MKKQGYRELSITLVQSVQPIPRVQSTVINNSTKYIVLTRVQSIYYIAVIVNINIIIEHLLKNSLKDKNAVTHTLNTFLLLGCSCT